MPSITGSIVLLTPGLSATPGAQSLTVPSDATGVVVFVSAAASVGFGVTSLSSNFAGTFTKSEIVAPDFNTYGIAALYADVTSTGSKTLTPVWNNAAEDGPILMVAFIKDMAASAWVRDIDLTAVDGAGTPTLTADSTGTDLVLFFQANYLAIGTTPTGCTSQATQGPIVTEYGRLSSVDSPGASTTSVTATTGTYPSCVLITIKPAASGIDAVGTDTNTLTDSAISITARLSVGTDTNSLSDSAVSITSRLSVGVDTLSFTDAAVSISILPVTATDSASFSDSALAAIGFPVSASDTITFSESAVSFTDRLSVGVDTLSLSDSSVSITQRLSEGIDTLSVSDSALGQSSYPSVGVDSLSLTDSSVATFVPAGDVVASDSISFSDSAATFSSLIALATDQIFFSDSAVVAGGGLGPVQGPGVQWSYRVQGRGVQGTGVPGVLQ